MTISRDAPALVCGVLLACVLHAAVAADEPSCDCFRFWSPVCAEGRTFGNGCVAECNGYPKATWVEGECGKGCICTEQYDPVCAEGNTFSNSCKAKCEGYLKYTKGACPKPCVCTTEFKPVCSEGKTYINACKAKCAGRRFVNRACGEACSCPPSKSPVCAKGKTFASSCAAKCRGYLSYTKGACRPPSITCDAGSSTGKCSGNVCTKSMSPCARNPLVTCVINPCSSATYLGTKLKNLQCKPIYVTKATSKVARNCNRPLPALACAPGSPTAKCVGNPCDTTTSPCKGNKRYVCLGNSCRELTYLGTKLNNAVCTAIFVDPLTRKVAKKCTAPTGGK